MTVQANVRRAGPSPGNGVATVYPFGFKTFLATDLLVQLTTVATGVIANLTLNVDYTVALNADQNANPGGSITTIGAISPIPASQTLTITSNMPEIQGTHLINGGAFFANNIEDMGDRNMMAVQDLAVKVQSSLQFPAVDGALVTTLPAAAQRANLVLGFDAAGNISLGIPFSSPASSPTFTNLTLTGAVLTMSGAGGGTITTGSAQPLSFQTSGGEQVRVTNTAGATRYISLTGSNGGNPTISTSAGNLNVGTTLVGTVANFSSGGASQAMALTSAGSTITLVLTDTGTSGCNLRFVGDGGTTPNKTIRAKSGNLEFMNSAYGAVLMTLGDGGGLTVGDTLNITNVSGGVAMTVPAGSGAVCADWRGRSSDNIGSMRFMSNSGVTQYGQLNWDSSNSLTFYTGTTPSNQFQITHTASANRTVNVTGSNGGNPALGVSGGGLDITPATLRFTGVGTTAAVTPLCIIGSVGSNDILRSTSTKTAKAGIQPFTIPEAENIVLNADWAKYESLSWADDPNAEYIGVTAERMAEIDKRFVNIGADGKPDAVAYAALVVPLGVLVRELWKDYQARQAH